MDFKGYYSDIQVSLSLMTSDKSKNTSLSHVNHLTIAPSLKSQVLTSSESSIRRNLKCPVLESSQPGDDIEDQDAIFSLSNPPDNIDEEFEVILYKISQLKYGNLDENTFCYKFMLTFYKLGLLFGKDRATGSNMLGQKKGSVDGQENEDAPPIPANRKSSCALPLKDQVETKNTKNKAIKFMCEELRSLRLGMDAIAMALEKGNRRNYTEE
ncbi:hypothetical protein Cgig2_028327 [Carnegiea gigantea]|uniref:Uncharacterized protein n=1 Tax=Carnegiea gigantea TaxID=171969 RepID=A0A9Q1KKU2_9CARY|nr:hypothetical protein Cgig2_028327 [Carnegiea gigantea]